MMRLLFTALAVLVVATFSGWLLQRGSGALIFTYGEWVIQTSLLVFALAFIVLFFLVYFLFWLARKLLRLPADLGRWDRYRRQRRSEKLLGQGVLALIEGNWAEAERAFKKGAAYSQAPLANYLGAARAAQWQGETARCDRYLQLAHQHDQDTGLATGLGRAELQISQQQVEQARETLKLLDSEQPGHDRVKLMLLEATAQLKDWAQMTELLKVVEQKRLLPIGQIRAKQLTAYAGLLQQAGAQADRTVVEKVWRDIPGRLKNEFYLVETYVKERLRHTDTDSSDCEDLLRNALKKKWDPELVRLFGLVEGKNAKQQLDFAEKSLARFPGDAALLLTLGRLCKKNRLWGKAKAYLEQSIEAQPNSEACQELAALLEQQGEQAAAVSYYRKGLNLAATLPMDPVPATDVLQIKNSS